MNKLSTKMEWCTKNSYSDDPSDNIGRCVLHSANLACMQSASGQNATFFIKKDFNFENEIDQLMTSEKFNKSLTVNKVNDITTLKKLHL